MQLSLLITFTFVHFALGHVLLGRSEENGPCTGSGGAPGVCIPTAKCTDDGGTFVNDKCPGTPEDIKCCTKTVSALQSHVAIDKEGRMWLSPVLAP